MSISFYIVKNGTVVEDIRESEYGEYNALELNVSNVNAEMLLSTLGIDYIKAFHDAMINDVALLERRCLDTLSLLRDCPSLDKGRVPTISEGLLGATMIECAPRDGYLTERIAQLRELAERALLEGGVIGLC